MYAAETPFARRAADYFADAAAVKPLLIGEFASNMCTSGTADGSGLGADCSVEAHYEWAAAAGYAGAWDWSMIGGGGGVDGAAECAAGMRALRVRAAVVAVTNLDDGAVPPPDTCSCSDVPPTDDYGCADQAEWGKCGLDWMVGYCCRSCFACSGCE